MTEMEASASISVSQMVDESSAHEKLVFSNIKGRRLARLGL